MEERHAHISRRTNETDITLELNIDGSGQFDINTGIGFLDHILSLWAKHGQFDLFVKATGDLHIDEHHTAEDTCICLGHAIGQSLGERRGLVRTAHSFVPMDEALAFIAVDLGGRPYCIVDANFTTPRVGQMSTDLIAHLLQSLATHGRFNLHANLVYGSNDHHKIEAIFKALGRALDIASRIDDRIANSIPSTKNVL